jgi:hypothetical protein
MALTLSQISLITLVFVIPVQAGLKRKRFERPKGGPQGERSE